MLSYSKFSWVYKAAGDYKWQRKDGSWWTNIGGQVVPYREDTHGKLPQHSEQEVRSSSEVGPKLIAVDRKNNKFFFMPISNDVFVHFTTSDRAKQIMESGKLLQRPPYEKFGTDTVDAVSLVYGKDVPGVQRTHIKSGKLVGVKFKTDTRPTRGWREETKWDQDVRLIDPEVISEEEAVSMLKRTKFRLGDQDQVVYDPATVKSIQSEYGPK